MNESMNGDDEYQMMLALVMFLVILLTTIRKRIKCSFFLSSFSFYISFFFLRYPLLFFSLSLYVE